MVDVAAPSKPGHRRSMKNNVFVFLAEAVAGQSMRYRLGARHAMLVYVGDDDIEGAQLRAAAFITESGWLHADIKRAAEVGTDVAHIEDDALRSAAGTALEGGRSIVVYADEVRANA